MARWLETLTAHSATGIHANLLAFAGLVMGLCAAMMVIGLCTGTSRGKRIRDKMSSDGDVSPRERHSGGDGAGSKNSLASKGEQQSKLQPISTTDQEQQGQHRPPVWQRTILMGERCQTPTFSGLILYDEKGNLLPIKAPRGL